MIWIIAFALVGGVIAIVDEYSDFEDGLLTIFLCGFMGVILSMVIGAFVAIVYEPREYTRTTTVELVNLADGSDVHGSFFLGSGSVDGYPNYSWYEETAENTYERFDVEASSAKIHFIYDDSEPRYELVEDCQEGNGIIHWWGFNFEGDSGCDEYSYVYHFYVPEGSIKRDYVLDAQG